MKKRWLAWSVLASLLLASAIGLMSCNRAAAITGEAAEFNLTRKAIANMKRQDGYLHVELLYFPSFESTFEEPKVLREKGKTVIQLRSYSPGPFYRKSEQQTNLAFKVPAHLVEAGTTVHFRSGDYDRVFATGKAP